MPLRVLTPAGGEDRAPLSTQPPKVATHKTWWADLEEYDFDDVELWSGGRAAPWSVHGVSVKHLLLKCLRR